MSSIPKDNNYSAVFDDIDHKHTKFEITETKKTRVVDVRLLNQITINTYDTLNKITKIISSKKYNNCLFEVYDEYGFKLVCIRKYKRKHWAKRIFKKKRKSNIETTIEFMFQKKSI